MDVIHQWTDHRSGLMEVMHGCVLGVLAVLMPLVITWMEAQGVRGRVPLPWLVAVAFSYAFSAVQLFTVCGRSTTKRSPSRVTPAASAESSDHNVTGAKGPTATHKVIIHAFAARPRD
jgi:hypothetical protein